MQLEKLWYRHLEAGSYKEAHDERKRLEALRSEAQRKIRECQPLTHDEEWVRYLEKVGLKRKGPRHARIYLVKLWFGEFRQQPAAAGDNHSN